MIETLRQVWPALRPLTTQQRFLGWCGALMLASGVVHGVVAVVDGAPWAGAVSWRKPVVFAMSFGILAWSAVWVLRQLPARRWGWIPAGLLGLGSVAEVSMITMQRWRGEPSHFNQAETFDSAVWSAMGSVVLLVALAVLVLLLWALARFEGTPAARVAVLVGLLAILVSGYVGFDMAAEGEAVVAATGQVPEAVVFGAAGSAKLAHALGMHGLQPLGLLAILLALRPSDDRAQVRVMLLASAGYTMVVTAVTVTAYSGRAWTSPTVPMVALTVAGALAMAVAAALVATRLRPTVARVMK